MRARYFDCLSHARCDFSRFFEITILTVQLTNLSALLPRSGVFGGFGKKTEKKKKKEEKKGKEGKKRDARFAPVRDLITYFRRIVRIVR